MTVKQLIAAVESGELLWGGYFQRGRFNLLAYRPTRKEAPAAPPVVREARPTVDGLDLHAAMLEAIRHGYADTAAMMARTVARDGIARLDGADAAQDARVIRFRSIFRAYVADLRDVEDLALSTWRRYRIDDEGPMLFGRHWWEYREAYRRQHGIPPTGGWLDVDALTD